MSDTSIAPAALNRITGMLARQYSAQPTPRDLDVANIAAAQERERVAQILRAFAFATVDPDISAEAGDRIRRAFGRALTHQMEGQTDGQ